MASEGIGPQAVSYVTQASVPGAGLNEAFFATTPYGRRFLRLAAGSSAPVVGAMVVGR